MISMTGDGLPSHKQGRDFKYCLIRELSDAEKESRITAYPLPCHDGNVTL